MTSKKKEILRIGDFSKIPYHEAYEWLKYLYYNNHAAISFTISMQHEKHECHKVSCNMFTNEYMLCEKCSLNGKVDSCRQFILLNLLKKYPSLHKDLVRNTKFNL